MKVINVLVVIVVIVAILLPAYLLKEAKNNFSHKRQYERNWQLKLPSKFKELDQYTNQGGFHGEGIRYTIFKSKEKHFSSILESTSGRKIIKKYSGDTLHDNERDIKKYVENILLRLDVSKDNIPNFNEVYLWQEFNYESDRLVVLYFPNRKLCYFVEELR
ncbi:hypothetical protein [Paenibacillus macquariensis]|uniref:DUF5590 domain-containing protein n=1 Tax=Paenibacillus macquariensis TaxID=948756 RepID=A0ABY1KD72_9BACL|nr:hypothetical protein [Paenibacillus macquariensis]MEC0094321.1 hypothetical protein [Paenibacillus macquariensis]OAB26339.1 hypothetical protein PMSM_26910 [Paenibacillus macquariensis subsp. macquariensis]SIR64276.1 hypothetical protein SAMN05421578_12612 [Paenibacillus macquariensis]